MLNKITILAVGSLLTLSSALAQQKRKVTVMDFGYATVRPQVQSYFGTDQDIGKGISDLLINQLLTGASYRVIQRGPAMDAIIKEQNFSNSDRINPSSAAKIGGLLGVDAIIIGDITSFGHDDKHISTGGLGGTMWNRVGGGLLALNKSKAIVEITARLVDVNTGEILASVTGHGEAQKSGVGLAGAGASRLTAAAGAFDMSSSNFAESQLGQAVKSSVTQLASGLDAKADSLPTLTVIAAPPPQPVDGLIADASTPEIIVNVGAKDGIKVGESLAVMRVGREIKDPVTGKHLRWIESAIGTLTITSVDTDSSIGKFSGTGTPKPRDHVKRPASN